MVRRRLMRERRSSNDTYIWDILQDEDMGYPIGIVSAGGVALNAVDRSAMRGGRVFLMDGFKGIAMLSYVTVGTNDPQAAGLFYDAVLAPLGYVRSFSGDSEIGYGPVGEKTRFYVMTPYDKGPATVGNGVDVAFDAPSRAAVDAFFAAAMAHGGKDEGGPGLRLHYGPDFYTAYVRDRDGNKLNAVFNEPVA
jgi:catechol 2,3-dioxygenase-like lactoylglutathione lyase family enzyme